DFLDEADESFSLILSDASNATILNPVGTFTINDDDEAPILSIDSVRQSEGDVGNTTFVFSASLSDPSGRPSSSFEFNPVDGTATLGDNDYISPPGIVSFPEEETKQIFTVQVVGDFKKEDDETFVVNVNPTKAIFINV